MTDLAFIIDTDCDRAVSFSERFEFAVQERNRLEPSRTRGERWRFMVENYTPITGSCPEAAELTRKRLAEIGGRLEAYTLN